MTDWKRRPRHCGRVAKTQVALLTLGPEDVVERVALEASLQKAQGKPPATCGRAGDDNTVHRTCQEAPLKPFRAQDWHSQCSKKLAEAEERLVRFRAEVELEGQRKSSVSSHVVASHPSSLPSKQFRWYKNAPPNDELAAKKFHRLPKSSRSGCEASGVERRSGNGTSIGCIVELSTWLQVVPRCRRCQVQHVKNWQRVRCGMRPSRGSHPPGHARIWPNRIWPILVLSCFGQIVVIVVAGCCCCCWACCCLLLFVGACWCRLVPVGGACWWCLLVLLFVCVVGVFKIFGPLPRTPPLPDRPSPGPPKISLFFVLSPAPGLGRRGFTRQPENSKRAHLRVPAFRNTTKIQREDTQRGKKRTKFCGGRGKKRAKFWAVRRRAVPGRAVQTKP